MAPLVRRGRFVSSILTAAEVAATQYRDTHSRLGRLEKEHLATDRVSEKSVVEMRGELANVTTTSLQHQLGTDTVWSAREIRRLKEGLRAGTSIPHLAAQLRRGIEEVRAKVDELTAQHLAERTRRTGRRRRRPNSDRP
jgi:hypothetical protein